MWREPVRKRYRWASVKHELDELILELAKAEDEEEVGLYLLKLHHEHELDPALFGAAERAKIKKCLAVLIRDTERHRRLLKAAVAELEAKKNDAA
ncbi:MAG: hypothetical protein HY714_04545 [Candidatus Omnitrophica bacterium]|nr:hypothetical protein [Candidatus Omnitrophota bacterium]